MNEYARFGTRLACHIGDLMIIQMIVLPLYMLLIFIGWQINYEIIIIVVWGTYSTIMNASIYKGTYGKKLMGVKVEMENGDKMSLLQSLSRYVIGFLFFGILIGMTPIFINGKRKGLHDILIGTVVRYRKFSLAQIMVFVDLVTSKPLEYDVRCGLIIFFNYGNREDLFLYSYDIQLEKRSL